MTSEDAKAKLAETPAGPKKIGTFVLAMRNREAHFTWGAKQWETEYTWRDAPADALAAWRETGTSSSSGVRAVFPSRGAVELATDASGEPYIRLTSDAISVLDGVPDRRMRFVSLPLRPWALDRTTGPRFAIEEARGWGPFGAVYEWGFRLGTRSTQEGSLTPTSRSWWFLGTGVTSIVTTKCAQFVSAQPTSTLSPVDPAIGIYAVLD